MVKVYELFLAREKVTLSKYAFLTENTRGREHPYTPCENRTEFQRDRDKIIHSESFRCLMNKTQVFLAPNDAHYRTRLTHTLEVTQIARIIARALRLNEDLCEAIAMGHDLGHTPFGHAGEDAMQKCYSPDFTHYKQSLRVVEKLENGGQGLNLTYEVRDGIVNHTGAHMASTLEGVIVKFADRIAYINHDIDDAIRGQIIREEDIPTLYTNILGHSPRERLNTLIHDIIISSEEAGDICMSPAVEEAMLNLRLFMFESVYTNPKAKGEEKKAEKMIEQLYEYYMEHTEQLPEKFLRMIENGETESRVVCDYIAGMSDRFATVTYTEIMIPDAWSVY